MIYTKTICICGTVLDIVGRQRVAVLELLVLEDEPLLADWNPKGALLVPDEGFDVADGVVGVDVQDNGLTFVGLHADLHALLDLHVLLDVELYFMNSITS